MDGITERWKGGGGGWNRKLEAKQVVNISFPFQFITKLPHSTVTFFLHHHHQSSHSSLSLSKTSHFLSPFFFFFFSSSISLWYNQLTCFDFSALPQFHSIFNSIQFNSSSSLVFAASFASLMPLYALNPLPILLFLLQIWPLPCRIRPHQPHIWRKHWNSLVPKTPRSVWLVSNASMNSLKLPEKAWIPPRLLPWSIAASIFSRTTILGFLKVLFRLWLLLLCSPASILSCISMLLCRLSLSGWEMLSSLSEKPLGGSCSLLWRYGGFCDFRICFCFCGEWIGIFAWRRVNLTEI